MILLIDNKDSFVHNIARYIRELGFSTQVLRNNAITVEQVMALQPSHIIISPGPGTPHQAGISLDIIQQLAPIIPILGICLGHQAIGQVYGAKITRAKRPMHGKASSIEHDGQKLFAELPHPLQAARYHSLIINEEHFPEELVITARCDQGEIMGVRHQCHPVFGLQFHPESILTLDGHQLFRNFLNIYS